MQAVILCAGKGIRMGELTKDKPKPLLKIGDKTLLQHKLEILPEKIDEIVLVVGYLRDKIRKEVGDKFLNKKVTYIEDRTLTGTAHALWQARDILNDRFLVMMGDDIYEKETIEKCLDHDFSIVCIKAPREETGSRILLDQRGLPLEFVTHKMYMRLREDGGMIFTGLYSLTPDIFNYEPTKLETRDEWGLPQTFLKLAKDKKIEIIETKFWLPISTPEELKRAEEILSQRN